jgi:DNA-binding MarR family transcriptional regulator
MKDWKPYDSLGGLITSLSLKMARACKQGLEASEINNITVGRFWVMHALFQQPQNQRSLCLMLQQSAPSMMEMLQRLQKDKLVKAKASQSDPRKKEWSLTDLGKKTYLNSKNIFRDVGFAIDSFFKEKNISKEEVEAAKKILFALDREHYGEKS